MARLPPLNGLKAFDAAARQRSFTAAARELHVTHGAVSRQVQQLEDYLNVRLFRRLPRGLELTAPGHMLALTTQQSFEQIAQAVADVRGQSGTNIVTLTTVASIAARWLMPRLSRFQSAHPEIEIRLSPTPSLVDFAKDRVDLGIRYGLGKWPNLYTERLFISREFPVCSPALLEGKHRLREPADLKHFQLLHDTTTGHWKLWLKVAGISDFDPGKGLVVEESNVLLQAAIEGQGVALAPEPLVLADIAAGRLVKPFDIDISVKPGYYLVCPRENLARPEVNAVASWLRSEAGVDEHSQSESHY